MIPIGSQPQEREHFSLVQEKKIIDSSYYFTTQNGNIARGTRISKLISLIMLGHSSKKSIDFEILEELE